MGRSQRLQLTDVTGVFQLVGECRELWADADAWQAHLVRGACRLTGTSVGSFTESWLSPDRKSTVIYDEIDLGWRDERARSYRQSMFRKHPNRVAFLPRVYRLAARALQSPERTATALRPEIRPDSEWYRSGMYNDYYRPAYIDGCVMSFSVNPHSGHLVTLWTAQDRTDPVPGERAKSVMTLLNATVAPLVGVELSARRQGGVRGLSPRLRQVLKCILAGESEKQVAETLQLTRHTVHQYVGMLYRHFEVASRSELLAYFVRRRPSLRTSD